jgi:cytochrome P450
MPTLMTRARPDGPSMTLDLHSREALLNPQATYRQIREAGAAVWLPKHRMWAIGRYRDVRDALWMGIAHACVGMHLSKLEMHAPLRAMIPAVSQISVSEPVPLLNNALQGSASFRAAFRA